ncbi:MAG: 3-deoxy-manno-octulosonate cytidylyltransferase [Spirosomataceae bacterium]
MKQYNDKKEERVADLFLFYFKTRIYVGSMKIIGIIPARWASSRLPQKALTFIHGKTMIQRVYERVAQVREITQIVVATDHLSIFAHVQGFGGNAVMTSPDIPSGTDRCAAAMQVVNLDYTPDFIVNIQGDEPLIEPESLRTLIQNLAENVQIATLVNRVHHLSELTSPNVVKVVVNSKKNALYFSRQAIPYMRDLPIENWLDTPYWKHIGIYAFKPDILAEITALPISSLEATEKLEQLRWLEEGYQIKVIETQYPSIGVDTLSDLEEVSAWIQQLEEN